MVSSRNRYTQRKSKNFIDLVWSNNVRATQRQSPAGLRMKLDFARFLKGRQAVFNIAVINAITSLLLSTIAKERFSRFGLALIKSIII